MGEERAAAQLVAATMEFLRKHPPFNEMDDAALALLVGHAKLGYYAKDTLVIGPATGSARTLWIVKRGHVRARIGAAREDSLEFGPGEAFPIAAVLAARPTTLDYVAATDLFCYEIGADIVARLMDTSAPFQHFCTHHMGSLLVQARERLREAYSRRELGSHSMLAPLLSTLRRAPVTCAPDAPLREALATMQRQKVSAIAVVDRAGAPQGIFTERDLLEAAVAGGLDLANPISKYMTPHPIALPASATLSEAALVMARKSIRHLLVSDQGKLTGVVSERSLFALQRLSMHDVMDAIAVAETVEALQAAAQEIRRLARQLLAQGVSAEPLTQLIAALNDKLTERILELQAARHALGGIDYCWLALGSEGRQEQTFATDQDNAIIFAAGERDGAEHVRERLLPFARAVNETLAACGFPLCKGGIMASNREWCLTAAEWRQRFGAWVSNPDPQALLNANIFFDLRPLWGIATLAQSLREWLRDLTRHDARFLRMMAENALATEPPLGFFGDIGTRGRRGSFDLKAQGTRVFTDAARIFALAAGSTASGTVPRLREAGATLNIPAKETEAVVEAFHFLLLLRLRQQDLDSGMPGDPDVNRIDPRELNDLDLRILKESLRQARKMQRRLALDYQL